MKTTIIFCFSILAFINVKAQDKAYLNVYKYVKDSINKKYRTNRIYIYNFYTVPQEVELCKLLQRKYAIDAPCGRIYGSNSPYKKLLKKVEDSMRVFQADYPKEGSKEGFYIKKLKKKILKENKAVKEFHYLIYFSKFYKNTVTIEVSASPHNMGKKYTYFIIFNEDYSIKEIHTGVPIYMN
ncbi:MAG: hypothetical protein MUC49_10825 [Raineya sp.]|jgi:hypothetical protein|nr:hypothetical protein [Raineya sp.]